MNLKIIQFCLAASSPTSCGTNCHFSFFGAALRFFKMMAAVTIKFIRVWLFGAVMVAGRVILRRSVPFFPVRGRTIVFIFSPIAFAVGGFPGAFTRTVILGLFFHVAYFAHACYGTLGLLLSVVHI